jgi:hypothetical protein
MGCVITRAITSVPPNVVLPAIIGAVGSLNTFVGLVGDSGTGKDSALSTAADAVDLGYRLRRRDVGTGQGIMGQFARIRKIPATDDQLERSETVRVLDRLLIHIPEIHALKSSSAQQGANILPTLTAAWSGSLLGGAYKDQKLDLEIDEHTYRLGMVAGVQPGEAEVLIKHDPMGLPQRFVWMPATDPRAASDHPPDWPGTMIVTLADTGPVFSELDELARPGGVALGERVEMGVCDAARTAILTERQLRNDPSIDRDPLDSHALFCRLKIAAGFAIMDGRMDVDDQDWHLAGLVMMKSKATRAGVITSIDATARRARDARKAEVIETALATSSAQQAKITAEQELGIERMKLRILDLLVRPVEGGFTKRKIKDSIRNDQRRFLSPALAELEEAGMIMVEDNRFKIAKP